MGPKVGPTGAICHDKGGILIWICDDLCGLTMFNLWFNHHDLENSVKQERHKNKSFLVDLLYD